MPDEGELSHEQREGFSIYTRTDKIASGAEDKDDYEELKTASEPGPLFRGFGLGNYPGRNVSVTWVPERIGDTEKWHFATRGRPLSPIFPGKSDETIGERKIAGKLIEIWLRQWIQEIWIE